MTNLSKWLNRKHFLYKLYIRFTTTYERQVIGIPLTTTLRLNVFISIIQTIL